MDMYPTQRHMFNRISQSMWAPCQAYSGTLLFFRGDCSIAVYSVTTVIIVFGSLKSKQLLCATGINQDLEYCKQSRFYKKLGRVSLVMSEQGWGRKVDGI